MGKERIQDLVMAAQEALLIGTRIADFRVAPTRVAVGESVTITGALQWHTPIICWWNPLEGKPIEVIADTVKIGDATSGSGGGFRFVWTPMSTGIYWVKSRFPGDLLYNGCGSATVRVDVITKEQKGEEERHFWTLVGVGAVIALAVVGGVVYTLEEQSRMRLILARRS